MTTGITPDLIFVSVFWVALAIAQGIGAWLISDYLNYNVSTQYRMVAPVMILINIVVMIGVSLGVAGAFIAWSALLVFALVGWIVMIMQAADNFITRRRFEKNKSDAEKLFEKHFSQVAGE